MINLQLNQIAGADTSDLQWRRLPGLSDYQATSQAMEQTVANIIAGTAKEQIWLLEHPPLYTAGTSANPDDLLNKTALPVFTTGRGGQLTYHGPGQRVIYIMLDLNKRGRDLRDFIARLELWIINCLADFAIVGKIIPNKVGVWVKSAKTVDEQYDKIAAIGIRVRRWVTFHGISINISPNLDHYQGIIPCGIKDGSGITSFADQGLNINMADLDGALINSFKKIF